MLVNRFPQIIAALNPTVEEAISHGVDLVVEDAKERVPVATGSLRDAIHKLEEDEGVYAVAGDDDAFYGHIVEHGSTRVPPHPFLVPALEAKQETITMLAGRAIGRL